MQYKRSLNSESFVAIVFPKELSSTLHIVGTRKAKSRNVDTLGKIVDRAVNQKPREILIEGQPNRAADQSADGTWAQPAGQTSRDDEAWRGCERVG